MEKIKQLKAELKALADKMQAAIDEAKDREMTAEEGAAFDADEAAFKAKEAELEKAEAEAQRKQRQEERIKAAKWQVAPPAGALGQPGEAAAERKRFSIPANVRRGGTLRSFSGERDGMTAEERAYRFGQFCLATISQQMPGRYNFSGAVQFVNDHMAPMAAAHDSLGTTGGFNLIPEEFGRDLIDLREQYGVARRLLKRVTMTSDTRTDPRRTGGLTAYFVAEGSAGTESTKGWDQVRLTAKDLMVLSRYTNQLSADAVISIGDDLASEISYAFANKEDECAFNGTGASTYGGIQGIRHKLQNVSGSSDSAGLKSFSGNLFSEIVLADFDAIVGALPQYADTPSAVWVMHRTFFYEVVNKLVEAAGSATPMDLRGGERRPRPMFKGYPVEFSQVYPSAAADTTVFCTLGDHALAASFGDRQQDSIAFSEHATVNSVSVFETNQIAVRGTQRFDINVHDVGDTSVAGPVVGGQTIT